MVDGRHELVLAGAADAGADSGTDRARTVDVGVEIMLHIVTPDPPRMVQPHADVLDAVRVILGARDALMEALYGATTVDECLRLRDIANSLCRVFENVENAALRKADGR
jgi:hypothetical protein